MKITLQQLKRIAEDLREANATKLKMEQISREHFKTYKEAIDDMVDAIKVEVGL